MNLTDLQLGAMAPPIHEQLGVSEGQVTKYQRGLEALNYLRIHGFLPTSIAWKRAHMLCARMLKDLAKQGVIE